jgi:hypothetical protein
MRLPKLTLYDLKRSIEKFRTWFGYSTSKFGIPNNLTVISPVTLPFSNIKQVRFFNRWSVTQAVKKEMKRLEFYEPIFLTTLPTAVDFIGKFNEVTDIYYCVDEFSKWPGTLKDLVEQMERELIEKVDLIITTSGELQVTKKKDSTPTCLLTHGVDINHFRKSQKLELAPAIKNLKKPVIGYFGLLDERTDASLIDYLARNKPEWTFVFIGPKKVDTKYLENNKNIFFFPPVSYFELPHYLAGIDVFIIPYKLDELAKYINPLKLKECLAVGKPVVSSPLPEVVKLKEVIRLAVTKEEFLRQIGEAILEPLDHIAVERVLDREDWSFKAEQMSIFIEEIISKRKLREN